MAFRNWTRYLDPLVECKKDRVLRTRRTAHSYIYGRGLISARSKTPVVRCETSNHTITQPRREKKLVHGLKFAYDRIQAMKPTIHQPDVTLHEKRICGVDLMCVWSRRFLLVHPPNSLLYVLRSFPVPRRQRQIHAIVLPIHAIPSLNPY